MFDWEDMVVAALIMLHLLPLISLDLWFGVSVARVGVLMVIGIWFLIWLLFVGSVDCIFNRWVGSIFVSVAVVRESCSMLLVGFGCW